MDVARGETAEAHLDALISKRHSQRVLDEGERAEHELWAESERLYFERESRRLRWAWVHHYEAQANRAEANAQAIAAANRRRAQALVDELVAEERNGHRNGQGLKDSSRLES